MHGKLELSLRSPVQQGTRHVAADLGGETALMSVENGMYYCLNATSSSIWALLERPRPVAEVCAALQSEFEVAPAECETAVLTHLSDLVRRRLVDVVDAETA